MRKVFSRFIYLGYYLKKLDWQLYRKFLGYASASTGKWKLSLIGDSVYSVFMYNISLLEYFQFRFFEKSSAERREWAGTGFMYEFQLKMNPAKERGILDDKRLFHKEYFEFIRHKAYSIQELKKDPALANDLLSGNKIVLKTFNGKGGGGTAFLDTNGMTPHSLIREMESGKFDLVESFIQQHSELQRLSPSAVNTVRIFTQLDKDDQVQFLGCRQRISINSQVDNMAAGNIVAPIDPETGIITGPGVYSDVTKEPESVHPVTGVPIVGFQVPYWKECVQLAKVAALLHPQNRSIGWDIVVTPDGPGLIEGNHDWCKLVWQLPVNRGMKNELLRYV